MAVALEYANVIIKKAALQEQYAGGVDAVARLEIPNFVEDEHLVRIGYMSTGEALGLADRLHEGGLDTRNALAIVESDGEVPEWLAVGEVGGRWACWLASAPPGEVMEFEARFILGCPGSAYKEFPRVCEQHGIQVRRSEHCEKELDEQLTCSRGEAAVSIGVNKVPDADVFVLWVERDFRRRAQCGADAELLKDMVALLKAHGASVPKWPR
jgi:hypothetical protein